MIKNSPNNKLTKTEIAKSLGLSRSSLYYHPKQPIKDKIIKKSIQDVLGVHPSYGHRRIALELKLNKKCILRIMKKFSLKPYRRRTKKPSKLDDIGKPIASYQNEIKNLVPLKPNIIWVADFTYIGFQNKFIYLATMMDLFTREIIGWNISINHDRSLVLTALKIAFAKTKTTPIYHHSDQGSEYDSIEYTNKLKEHKIIISMSKKAHPWENGFQESFYSEFKLELGWINRFETLGELIEAIYLQINYYNTKRIHTSLKTSPVKFKDQYLLKEYLKTLKNINLQTFRQSV